MVNAATTDAAARRVPVCNLIPICNLNSAICILMIVWQYKRQHEPMHIHAAILWEQGQPLSVEAAELDASGAG